MKKSLIISISFLLIGIGIGISIVTWTNAEDNIDSTLESVEVKEALPEYTGILDDKATAINYLKNGNFYSKDKSYAMIIDTSYMDLVSYAIYWYDKVISEYPKTPAANRALKDKMKTLIGWTKGYGDDRRNYGLRDRTKASIYFPLLEATYVLLEKDYPDDLELSAFAFQIAQEYLIYLYVYRNGKYLEPSKKWITKTIQHAKGKDTFYSHLAKHHLARVAKYE